MLKQTITIAVLALGLTGCASWNSSDPCVKMKRELLYNESNRNVEAAWSTAEQRAKFKQEMADAGCK